MLLIGANLSARGEAGYRSGFRFQRPGVRIPPGGPAASCRFQVAHLTLWGVFSFAPAPEQVLFCSVNPVETSTRNSRFGALFFVWVLYLRL